MHSLIQRIPYERTDEKESIYGGSFFVFLKAVLRVGAQAIFPFKRLFRMKMGKLPGCLLGTITKEMEPYDSFSFLSF